MPCTRGVSILQKQIQEAIRDCQSIPQCFREQLEKSQAEQSSGASEVNDLIEEKR